jgi:uncharacterized protein (TIGR02466 family)
MIENVFPTPVGFYELDKPVTTKELQFIKDLETRANDGNTTSIDNYLLKSKEMKRIAAFIDKSVQSYFKEVYAAKHEVKPYVTQSWANYTNKGQYHHKHAHPNSFISGVFYVSAEPSKDRLYFYKDGYKQIKIETEDWNVWNSDSWWFPVESGKVIIFPSHLSHMVQTVETEDTRISIAFNTFLEGVIGDNLNISELLLWLKQYKP